MELRLRVLASFCHPSSASELSSLKEALGVNVLDVTDDAPTGTRAEVHGHSRLHVAPCLGKIGYGRQQLGVERAR